MKLVLVEKNVALYPKGANARAKEGADIRRSGLLTSMGHRRYHFPAQYDAGGMLVHLAL